jgi:hypothetical protein
MSLELTPLTLREANAFVDKHHRHHGSTRGHLFSVGASIGGVIVAVAIVGRPVARMLQDGYTAEVLRLCSDGTKNTCSMLYAAAWRAVRAMGYRKLVTYLLITESGISLKAAGWKCIGEAGGGSWSRSGRPRVDTHPLQKKIRFEVAA